MRFLLELPENNRPVSIEVHALKDAIENSRQEEYKMAVPNYFSNLDEFHSLPQTLKTSLEETVPVGSIDFVQSYLRKVHGIDIMHPIEIPERLRIPKILLRDYHIVRYEHLPKEGRWFIKDVSKLKNGSFAGKVTTNTYKDFDPTHLYQFSSLLNIISEYRVFVYRDRIQGIQWYLQHNTPLNPEEPEGESHAFF